MNCSSGGIIIIIISHQHVCLSIIVMLMMLVMLILFIYFCLLSSTSANPVSPSVVSKAVGAPGAACVPRGRATSQSLLSVGDGEGGSWRGEGGGQERERGMNE